MADAPTTPQAGTEPSMEEILASIRRIISDEPAAPAETGAETEDVLELTQEIHDDGTVTDVTQPEPLVEVVPAAPAPPPASASVPEPEPAPAPVVASAETLVSDQAASTAASALSALANTVEIEQLASLPRGATPLGNGARTLEDMVIEMMRPLLKQWLDQNLAPIVERLVQKEVERISRRS